MVGLPWTIRQRRRVEWWSILEIVRMNFDPKNLGENGSKIYDWILNFDNLKFFFGGKFRKFMKLCFNTQNLSVIFFCAFSDINYVSHFSPLFIKIFFYKSIQNRKWQIVPKIPYKIVAESASSAKTGGENLIFPKWWCLLDEIRTFFEQNPEDFADWIPPNVSADSASLRRAKQKNFLHIFLFAPPQIFFQLRKRKFFCFAFLLTQELRKRFPPPFRLRRAGKNSFPQTPFLFARPHCPLRGRAADF